MGALGVGSQTLHPTASRATRVSVSNTGNWMEVESGGRSSFDRTGKIQLDGGISRCPREREQDRDRDSEAVCRRKWGRVKQRKGRVRQNERA